jgi:hypothetical protein
MSIDTVTATCEKRSCRPPVGPDQCHTNAFSHDCVRSLYPTPALIGHDSGNATRWHSTGPSLNSQLG